MSVLPNSNSRKALLTLIVSPVFKPEGGRLCSTRGRLFDARLEGGRVVCRSHQPFLDGARALLKLGVARSDDLLVMRHVGGPESLLARVGVAARFRIKDDPRGCPQLAPFDREGPAMLPRRGLDEFFAEARP